jgi:hypothetical protein
MVRRGRGPAGRATPPRGSRAWTSWRGCASWIRRCRSS